VEIGLAATFLAMLKTFFHEDNDFDSIKIKIKWPM